MQAYYEVETEIQNNHQLNLQLPNNIPIGRAKVAIIYEWVEPTSNKSVQMVDFLNNLPLSPTGGLSKEQIQTYLKKEREQWDI
jgi:hypothetical protein